MTTFQMAICLLVTNITVGLSCWWLGLTAGSFNGPDDHAPE